jgi:hypothetical protein
VCSKIIIIDMVDFSTYSSVVMRYRGFTGFGILISTFVIVIYHKSCNILMSVLNLELITMKVLMSILSFGTYLNVLISRYRFWYSDYSHKHDRVIYERVHEHTGFCYGNWYGF